jgi:hypothetical protein
MTASALLSFEPMTEDERKQLAQLAEEAMAKALLVVNPSHMGAQRIHMHSDEIVSAIIDKVRELSACDKFSDEEMPSNYGYLCGYRQAREVGEQAGLLRQIFPGIGFADERLARRRVPEGAEGWFAIPRWETIAPAYGGAVERVFVELAKRRGGKFVNFCEGQLGEPYLRQTNAARSAFQKIGDEQKGHGVLVVAAQFGIAHRGRSVRRARERMRPNEFGLGAFEAGIMLLTHPERLQRYDDLSIDCAGDEYSAHGDGEIENAPYFGFYGGWLEFDKGRFEDANDRFGSASGFLPQ